jgi:hypothetical protein
MFVNAGVRAPFRPGTGNPVMTGSTAADRKKRGAAPARARPGHL